MNKMKIFTFLSLLPLTCFAAIYNNKYPLTAIGLLIIAACYIYNNKISNPEKKYFIVGGILLVPIWLHFVGLWSNLVLINKIAKIIHIPSTIIVGAVGLVFFALSLYGISFILHELWLNISQLKLKKINIDRFIFRMSALFVIVSAIVITLKVNYHLDELLSYGLANHKDGIYMTFDEGVTYQSAKNAFIEYLAVDQEYRFDYSIPYTNQVNDVHPPFYYYILHTISSFFPGTFSKWFAGIINIVFGTMALIILAHMILLFSKGDRKPLYVLLPAFILSAGILNATAFFRMYIITLFWALLISLMLVQSINRKHSSYVFYILLYWVILGAALTHYYLIIYSVFLCTIYGVLLLLQKRWKDIFGIILSSGMAALSAISLFPAMLAHMFEGYRGEEAIENFGTASDVYLSRILATLNLYNTELFGHLFIIILIISIISIIIIRDSKYIMLFSSVTLYSLMITLIAGRVEKRYLFPIYGVLFFIGLYAIYVLTDKYFKKIGYYVFICMTLIITISGLINYDWEYLYREDSNLINFAENNKNVDCICIYGLRWMVQPSYVEARNYNSITFIRNDDLYMLSNLEICDDEELVVILAGTEMEDVLEDIKQAFPNLDDYQEIGSHSLSVSYYFE